MALSSHRNQRNICITILFLIVIVLSVRTFLVYQYQFDQLADSLLYPTPNTTTNRLKRSHCESLPIHNDVNEPKLLVNMHYFRRYLDEHEKISGWVNFETFYAIWLFVQFQYRHLQNIDGAIGEIGVHRGKLTSYIYLMRHRDTRQKLFAVDTFEKKSLNIDSSGNGDRAEFLQNVQKYANVSANEIILYEGSSMDLNPYLSNINEGKKFWSQQFGKNSCQLVSIDGGHTTFLTYSDLCLISNSLVDGGIVMVDDIDHPDWLGVRDGVIQCLAETSIVLDANNDPEVAGIISKRLFEPHLNISCRIVEATRKIVNSKAKCSRLIPILQYSNKLYLTTPNYYPHYMEYLKRLNNEGTNFIRYDSLKLTVGNVPVWCDSRTKYPEIFEKKVKPLWLAELAKATE